MLKLILASILIVVNAEFELVPLINEAVVGQSTLFDCTTTTHTNEVHWYHYRVGAKDHEDICIYCLDQVHPQYENRIEVERILGTDTYRLRIKSVQWEDAGRYICQDNGGIGDSLFAELVVLESTPVCHTYMEPDGLLGPNACNMEPDVLLLSCSASFHGNIPPKIQWREVRSANPIKRGVSCRQAGNQMTCNLAMTASFDLYGSSYVCETTTSTTNQHNCSSGVINIIHVNINNMVSEVILGTKGTVSCLANSSQSCSYKWKWVDGVNEEVVSYGAALQPRKTGWYKCEADCSIHGNQCTVLSRQIHVTQQTTKHLPEEDMIPVTNYYKALRAISVPVIIWTSLLIIVLIHARRQRNLAQSLTQPDRQPLLLADSRAEKDLDYH